jgi:hypothetical protein
MKISVCCPSYKRPKVKTLEYLPFCRVYVAPDEFAQYQESNPAAAIIQCDIGIQGNVARVRNYILDQEFALGNEAVAIVDDDMRGIFCWEHNKAVHKLPAADFFHFIEKHSTLARDIGAFLWGININPDPQCYRECTPFSTLSFIGGPFGCFLAGNNCRYDESLPLKEDYDMTLQQLNKNRIVLRVNKYYYMVKQSEQSGGCASMRNIAREKEQLDLLRKKWGSRIVRTDTQDRSNRQIKGKSIVFVDYNPIIRVPIKGV